MLYQFNNYIYKNNNMKTTVKDLIMYLWFIMVLWMPVSMFIQAMYCAEMTQTEVLLNIFDSLILNFKHC